MVLDIPGNLFGKDKRGLFEDRKITVGRPQSALRLILPGWSGTGSATFTAGGPQNFKDNIGFVTNITIINEGGASRNITVLIENLTTGETLISGNIDLAHQEGFNESRYWSNDDIRPGDVIKFTIGNEGPATAYLAETTYYSIPGASFNPINTEGRSVTGMRYNADESQTLTCPVLLPHGVYITKAIVYGAGNEEAWDLYRVLLTDASSLVSIGSQNLNSEDAAVNHTVNNNTYSYGFKTSTLDSADDIDGARVTFIQAKHPNSAGYYRVELSGVFGGQDESSI